MLRVSVCRIGRIKCDDVYKRQEAINRVPRVPCAVNADMHLYICILAVSEMLTKDTRFVFNGQTLLKLPNRPATHQLIKYIYFFSCVEFDAVFVGPSRDFSSRRIQLHTHTTHQNGTVQSRSPGPIQSWLFFFRQITYQWCVIYASIFVLRCIWFGNGWNRIRGHTSTLDTLATHTSTIHGFKEHAHILFHIGRRR